MNHTAELDYDNHPDDEGNHLSEQASPSEGWAWPSNSRKAHYFVGGRSLCAKWRWLHKGGLDDTPYTGPDDCKECVRKLNKRRYAQGLFRINVID